MIAAATPKDEVTSYIDGVMSGEIVVGRLVKLAVERHLADLKNAEERGYYFDEEIARDSVDFFPLVCHHSIGEWDGLPFTLSPWQQFAVWCIQGWRRRKDGTRRFRKAYISVARKNGKTTFCAGLAAELLYADEPFEPGAQIYMTATKVEQAAIMYEECRRMVEASPSLRKRTKIRKAPRSLNYEQFASRLCPIATDNNLDGLNPSAVFRDEYHEWREKHRGASEKLSSGGGSRRQPLDMIITTAGDDHSQLWIEEDDYAVKVLESVISGNIVDDRMFALVYRIDDNDDPFNEDVWIKANPNLGVSVKIDFLREEANQAKQKPSETNKFLRYYCNKRVAACAREITAEMWAKGNKPLTIEPGAYGYGGVDLARSNDWSAIACMFPIKDKDGVVVRYELFTKTWTCRHGRFRIDREPFRQWISDGRLIVCPGDQIDFAEIEREIVRLNNLYSIRNWSYDPAWSRELMQRLNGKHGVEVFPFSQSHTKYNEPCVRFVKDLCAEKIYHGGCPVLEWQASNLIYDRNSEKLSRPDKSNQASKIDGIVASLMAFGGCLYEERQNCEGSMFIG